LTIAGNVQTGKDETDKTEPDNVLTSARI
jgi:hypothetical protein